LNEAASESILFAGGIGITPILAMAKRLRAIDAKFSMHYCTRSKERTAFMRSMMASDISDRLQFHFDDENEMQKLNLNACLENANPDAHLYVCGPRGFMDYVLSTARTLGWGENSLHYEFFSGDAQSSADNQPFEVVIASTGTTIRIPANKTVVAALADHGIEIPTSCEQGVCGTCITGVLEGIPLHKDQFLTPEERSRNNQFLPCCSRASTTSLKLNL
jgi:vanillate O-demethylase ferredoxin subunit